MIFTPCHRDHLDQYPLALLLEDGYLGVTINHTPPTAGEEMREFSLATMLHMFTLPKDADGVIHYLGIKSSGSIDPEKQRVFLRAKGALYLDEQVPKFWTDSGRVFLDLVPGHLQPLRRRGSRGN